MDVMDAWIRFLEPSQQTKTFRLRRQPPVARRGRRSAAFLGSLLHRFSFESFHRRDFGVGQPVELIDKSVYLRFVRTGVGRWVGVFGG